MQAKESTLGPLASHWQASGWFGAQLGGTAWLFISALVVARQSPQSAAVLLGCGLAANLVGCLLWSQRARLDPYRALQTLVAVVVLAGGAATRWLELRGEFALLDPRVSPHAMYLLLLALSVVLLAVFEAKRRAAKAVTG
jgi:hypothetical protein